MDKALQCWLLCYFSGQVDEGDGQRISNNLTPPRHSHIPEIPMDGNLVFELMVLCNSILGLGLQYVNLYKTVWWLPYSHANYALVCINKG